MVELAVVETDMELRWRSFNGLSPADRRRASEEGVGLTDDPASVVVRSCHPEVGGGDDLRAHLSRSRCQDS